MGAFSFLDSKSTSHSTTNTTTQNAAFSDLGQNATAISTLGSNNSINLLDGGVINRAFDFAQQSQGASLDLVKDLNTSTRQTMSESIQAVSELSRGESENVVLQLQRTAFYGALVWGAVAIYRSSRTK